eukprot:1178262-Prorocentrum_minimum.AAC.1
MLVRPPSRWFQQQRLHTISSGCAVAAPRFANLAAHEPANSPSEPENSPSEPKLSPTEPKNLPT